MGFFNRRIHTRNLQQGHAMFVGNDGNAFLVDVRDISQGGCQVSRPRTWPYNVGDVGVIYIFGDVGTVPNYQGKVAWFREESVGIEFAANP
jgi:hypothetical protein